MNKGATSERFCETKSATSGHRNGDVPAQTRGLRRRPKERFAEGIMRALDAPPQRATCDTVSHLKNPPHPQNSATQEMKFSVICAII